MLSRNRDIFKCVFTKGEKLSGLIISNGCQMIVYVGADLNRRSTTHGRKLHYGSLRLVCNTIKTCSIFLYVAIAYFKVVLFLKVDATISISSPGECADPEE